MIGSDVAERPRLFWADAMRAVAICSVVLLHAAAANIYNFGQIPGAVWWTSNLYDAMGRIGVPLFLMLSGFLLLDRTESLTTYYIKRLSKVAIPLAAWTVFYVVVMQPGAGTLQRIPQALLSSLSKPAYFHLGFLYQLLAIYIALPVLRPFVRTAPRAHLWYFVGVWIVVSSVLPILQRFFGFTFGINVTMFSGVIGYPVLGFALGRASPPRCMRVLAGLVCLAGVAATALGTYLLTRVTGRLDEYWFQYTSPNVVIMSAAAFLLLRSAFGGDHSLRPWLRGVVAALSATSFGIYLVHPAIQDLLDRVGLGRGFNSLHMGPVLAIPLTGLVVLVLALACTALLQRLPVVKRIVPK